LLYSSKGGEGSWLLLSESCQVVPVVESTVMFGVDTAPFRKGAKLQKKQRLYGSPNLHRASEPRQGFDPANIFYVIIYYLFHLGKFSIRGSP